MTTVKVERPVRLSLPVDGASPQAAYQPVLAGIVSRYQAAVVRDMIIDPVSCELIRLRCAHVHDCRHCSHVRLRGARQAGADEGLLAQVDSYETSDQLSARQKVMLRLADAHIFGSVPPSLPAQVGEYLTPAEAVEVVLLVSKFSYQKVKVALGLDGVEGYDEFDFDPATGEVIDRA
jgi:alkylhydroperoxidase family enzyme